MKSYTKSYLKQETERIKGLLIELAKSEGLYRTDSEIESFIQDNVQWPITEEKTISTKEEKAQPITKEKTISITTKEEQLQDGSKVIIISLAGDTINQTGAKELEDIIRRFLKTGFKYFILVLTDIKKLDSSGLGYIINIKDFLDGEGGSLNIVVPEHLKPIFNMLGLQAVFEPTYKLEDAIKVVVSQKRRAGLAGGMPPARKVPPPMPQMPAPAPPKPKPEVMKDIKPMAPPPIPAPARPTAPGIAEPAPSEDRITPARAPEEEMELFGVPEKEKLAEEKEFFKAPPEVLAPGKEEKELLPKEEPVDIQKVLKRGLIEKVEFEKRREAVSPATLMMAKKKRVSPVVFLIKLPFKIISLPFIGIFYLFKGLFSGIARILSFVSHIKSKLIQKAEDEDIAVFEIFLSENAGTPGPGERLVAQSVLLMKAIQYTIGLKFILFANFVDNIVNMITGYVQGIFYTWKMMKTVRRRIQRELSGTQVQSVAEDLFLSRIQLSRLLYFSAFSHKRYLAGWEYPEKFKIMSSTTFPLKLALETRGHLDEMKRDLSMITTRQVFELVKGSVGEFLISLVPNPMDLLTAWKDLFILTFIMKYSRQEIEKIYMDIVLSYKNMLTLLEGYYNQKVQNKHVEVSKNYHHNTLMDHEVLMCSRLGGKKIETQTNNLGEAVSKCRRCLQRVVQILCNPGQFLNPRKWARLDILKEIVLEGCHPQYELELERWLTDKIKDTLKKKGMQPDLVEKGLRYKEAKEFYERYNYQKEKSFRFE